MKSPVQLYLRVRFSDGSYPYLKAAFASNGRLRPHHAIHSGRTVEFPGAIYHLRYSDGAKRVWEVVGADPTLALTRLHRKAAELQLLGDEDVVCEPVSVPAPPPAAPEISQQDRSQFLVNDAIREYLAETLAHKSRKTFCSVLHNALLLQP